jgi:hypothetical protein
MAGVTLGTGFSRAWPSRPRVSPLRWGLVTAGLLSVLVLGAGCGSGSKLPNNVLQAGQLDIQLPPGWKVTHDGVVSPAQPGSGAAVAAGGATTTIPLAKKDPTTEFFQATSSFSACLKGLGVSFVGAPDPSHPSSPANDPNYLKALEKCAAQSNILQALRDFQASQNNLTPKQIQQENQQYLRWRTCMIARGWTIPQPSPDSQGRLFSVSTSGGGLQLTPPAGQSVFNSPDIQACTAQAQASGSSGKG